MILALPVTCVWHYLKCHPGPFAEVKRGFKRHEVRVSDRDYQTGDHVVLREWDPSLREYSGEELHFLIGHVTRGPSWDLPDDLCVFTLIEVGGR